MPSDAVEVPIQRLDPELGAPVRMRAGDAAADLASAINGRLEPGERRLFPTGFAVAIPVGHAGLVLSRSGLALHDGIAVLNAPGLIDSGYRGEVGVILVNHGTAAVSIERGQRIAQLMVIGVPALALALVEDLPSASDGRGAAGFGSSGA
jgi:dUTP pyrophosphatase